MAEIECWCWLWFVGRSVRFVGRSVGAAVFVRGSARPVGVALARGLLGGVSENR